MQADPAAISSSSSRTVRAFDLRIRPRRSSQDLLQIVPGLVVAPHAGGGKAEQIFMRGFDSGFGSDVGVSVDGMPVNLVSHGHGQGYADLHFLIPEVVERMEVFKGPYFAEYGNLANAGQVVFHTRNHLPQNTFQIEGGRFDAVRYLMLYQLPSADADNNAYFAGDYYHIDGPFDRPQDLRRLTLFAKIYRQLSADATLTLTAGGFNSSWDAPGLIPVRAVERGQATRWGAINDAEGGSTARQNLNLSYQTRTRDESSEFTAQAYLSDYSLKLFSDFTFFLQDPVYGDMIEQTDNRLVAGLNSKYRFGQRLGPILSTSTLGGGFRSDNIQVELWQVIERRRYWPLVEAGIRERNFFLWGQEELTFTPELRLVLGLRGDHFTFQVDDATEVQSPGIKPLTEIVKQIRTRAKPLHVSLTQPHASGFAQQTVFSPKANLMFSPSEELDLFANFGTGFHSNDARSVIIGQLVKDQVRVLEELGLNEEEIIAVLDTLNFDPGYRDTGIVPRTVGSELGFRLRVLRRGSSSPAFNRGAPVVSHYPGDIRFHAPVVRLSDQLNVGAAIWWIDVEDEFIYAADVGETEKRGRTRRWGLDLEARMLLLPGFWADADLNLARGRLRDEPEGADAIPLAPRLTSAGGLTMRPSDQYEGSLRYRHIGDRPATEDGSVRAAGYTLFDLAASYHHSKYQINLVVENLLNTEWSAAQFATRSLMHGEGLSPLDPIPGPEIHFTPGNPFNVRLGVSYFF